MASCDFASHEIVRLGRLLDKEQVHVTNNTAILGNPTKSLGEYQDACRRIAASEALIRSYQTQIDLYHRSCRGKQRDERYTASGGTPLPPSAPTELYRLRETNFELWTLCGGENMYGSRSVAAKKNQDNKSRRRRTPQTAEQYYRSQGWVVSATQSKREKRVAALQAARSLNETDAESKITVHRFEQPKAEQPKAEQPKAPLITSTTTHAATQPPTAQPATQPVTMQPITYSVTKYWADASDDD